MLLSVERPLVGAFAFHIPRAMPLLRNGLVQAVLPASRNMANGHLRFARDLGDLARLLGKFPVEILPLAVRKKFASISLKL